MTAPERYLGGEKQGPERGCRNPGGQEPRPEPCAVGHPQRVWWSILWSRFGPGSGPGSSPRRGAVRYPDRGARGNGPPDVGGRRTQSCALPFWFPERTKARSGARHRAPARPPERTPFKGGFVRTGWRLQRSMGLSRTNPNERKSVREVHVGLFVALTRRPLPGSPRSGSM